MSKTWYPVIDYTKCTECGTCIKKCSHGVYNPEKAPSPVVINPNGCIDRCHGCGNLCPQGAITYVGDTTGGKPPNGKLNEAKAKHTPVTGRTIKTVAIDFLYLDLNTCKRCMTTDTALNEAVKELSVVLRTLGYKITVNSVNIINAKMAEQYRFLSSPTIRVNGRDICLTVEENKCTDCGDICGSDVDCRVFIWKNKKYNQPPKAMIMDSILKAIYGPKKTTEQKPYVLPENLKKFFKFMHVKINKN